MELNQTTTTIQGYTVTVFKGYYGTQLFINDPQGTQIYAHKIDLGCPIERAKEIIGSETVIQTPVAAPAPQAEKICLNDRRDEFKTALKRGFDQNLEVFADWEPDTFVVRNHETGAEYRVEFYARAGRAFSSCTCPDFIYRKRVCKHQAAVLEETFFGVCGSFGTEVNA